MTVVQGTANGTIRYNIPSSYQGTTFENVELTFRDGVIIQAKSNHTELLNEILDTDKGARRIGEFAIGFNPLIRRPMLDTLFDEKCGCPCISLPETAVITPQPSTGIWSRATILPMAAARYGSMMCWFVRTAFLCLMS